MTLTRRITLVTAVTVAASTVAVAMLAAFSGRSTSIAQVDERLEELRSDFVEANDPVAELLDVAGTTSSKLAGWLVVIGEEPISLLDEPVDGDLVVPSLDAGQLMTTKSAPQTVDDRLRLVAVDLGEDQWLVFGEEIGDIQQRFMSQLATNSLLAMLLTLVGGLLAAAVTRRSMAPLGGLIDYSRRVAGGHLGGAPQINAPTPEVRELQRSIVSMVESLQDAAEVRARSESAMRDFLADVAHELRTPLTTISAYSEILASGQQVELESRTRAQGRIVEESKRMSRLIDDLLLLARLASTRTERTERVDVPSILRTHLDDLSAIDPDRRIDARLQGASIGANSALIERMFANVVSNIHRHSPRDARVEAATTITSANLEITIDDAGPGLDDGQLARITQGTERFSMIRSDDRHGTGLGLHLVASIARAHSGEAHFERSPLGGLRVRIVLPLGGAESMTSQPSIPQHSR